MFQTPVLHTLPLRKLRKLWYNLMNKKNLRINGGLTLPKCNIVGRKLFID